MRQATLGSTGIAVSPLCFGTLTVGPLQAKLPLEQGAEVLAHGIRRGITFFDTAQLYGTYPYLRRAMERAGVYDIVVSTKTYAYDRGLAQEAVEQARQELNRDYIDVFMLHEQESVHTLRGHREALETLMTYQSRGVIRAVGASMHHVAAVRGAVELGLEVIHPLLNVDGLGIVDGSCTEMEQALMQAHGRGIGIFSMKPLGGGNLFSRAADCLDYITRLPYVDSVAVGMQSVEEVDANLEYWEQGCFSAPASEKLRSRVRRLHIDSWCEGCGACVAKCSQKALELRGGKAVCRHEFCVLCGYCAAQCPAWAIKVV